MAFPEELVAADEQVHHVVSPHWSEVVPALIGIAAVGGCCVAALAFDSESGGGPEGTSDSLWFVPAVAGTIAVVLLAVAMVRMIHWLSTRYAITSHRVILREGLLSRQNRDVPLGVIQDVHLREPVIARLVGAGSLELQSAAVRGHTVLRWVPQAQEVRRLLHQLIQDRLQQVQLQPPGLAPPGFPPPGDLPPVSPPPAGPAGPLPAGPPPVPLPPVPLPPVAPPPADPDLTGQLHRLSELHEAGHLTAEEFAAAKRQLLGLPETPPAPTA